jgi:hypothetical protein
MALKMKGLVNTAIPGGVSVLGQLVSQERERQKSALFASLQIETII